MPYLSNHIVSIMTKNQEIYILVIIFCIISVLNAENCTLKPNECHILLKEGDLRLIGSYPIGSHPPNQIPVLDKRNKYVCYPKVNITLGKNKCMNVTIKNESGSKKLLDVSTETHNQEDFTYDFDSSDEVRIQISSIPNTGYTPLDYYYVPLPIPANEKSCNRDKDSWATPVFYNYTCSNEVYVGFNFPNVSYTSYRVSLGSKNRTINHTDNGTDGWVKFTDMHPGNYNLSLEAKGPQCDIPLRSSSCIRTVKKIVLKKEHCLQEHEPTLCTLAENSTSANLQIEKSTNEAIGIVFGMVFGLVISFGMIIIVYVCRKRNGNSMTDLIKSQCAKGNTDGEMQPNCWLCILGLSKKEGEKTIMRHLATFLRTHGYDDVFVSESVEEADHSKLVILPHFNKIKKENLEVSKKIDAVKVIHVYFEDIEIEYLQQLGEQNKYCLPSDMNAFLEYLHNEASMNQPEEKFQHYHQTHFESQEYSNLEKSIQSNIRDTNRNQGEPVSFHSVDSETPLIPDQRKNLEIQSVSLVIRPSDTAPSENASIISPNFSSGNHGWDNISSALREANADTWSVGGTSV